MEIELDDGSVYVVDEGEINIDPIIIDYSLYLDTIEVDDE